MDILSSHSAWKWQVVYYFYLCNWGWVSGQLRYSIVEESKPGTIVGNLAQDLGIAVSATARRRFYLRPEINKYFTVYQENGALTVKERIDRDSLCGPNINCLVQIEVITENPVELFSVEIEILDINDNSPTFSTNGRILKITELVTIPGVRFPLEIAQDLDIGKNCVSQYRLDSTSFFSLSVKNRKDGILIPELVLEKILDREEKREHKLTLFAIDGGELPRTGSTQITVIVLDINDNAPVFDHSIYKISLMENAPLQTLLIKLNATDSDEGTNAEIEYFFDDHTSDSAKALFDVNKQTGDIYTKGTVDFEDTRYWELSVRAVDKGVPELEGRCIIQVEVEDLNDNPPEITFTSVTNAIPENAPLGTVIGFLVVTDKDTDKNGEIELALSPNVPFKLKSVNSRYSLITDGFLDREKVSKYVITLLATDLGSPPLQTQIIIHIDIDDVNDNSPVFQHPLYSALVKENSEPGTLLCTLSATDLDDSVNSQLIYSIPESQTNGISVSSFVYINPKTGDIFSQRSFDYEEIQVLQITVKVEDSGFPTLISNVSVVIFVLDVNDNYPKILYPEHSTFQENVPRSATIGYLVTKVSAVDLDSGHNAWLVFRLVEATTPMLFQVSAYTGEIRTSQSLQDVDNPEQRLVVSVSDHGEPSLSATVIIVINIVDNVVYEDPKSPDLFTSSKSTPANLTLYLIISLVAISLVSLVTFIILLVKCFRRSDAGNDCGACFLTKSEPKYYTDHYKPTLYLNSDGTLKYMEVRMVPPEYQGTSGGTYIPPAVGKTDLTFMEEHNFTKDMLNEVEAFPKTALLNGAKQAQPNTEWRFSQAQRPGPSGAQPTEEAGVWPNNQFETERLQAMILASANEAAEGTSGLGGGTGTMGLSARYGPQFTLQHVPDYRQNVYIPGSTLTPTNAAGKRDGKSGGNKKKSGKKEKK
ncbi:protocadherin gamma-C5-like isoform X19 [Spea bombifrons]|uniref:protocadherin gamma-C5-like isoform X19 n=1 Tax=Spea bombifrons TaxID=233779 RepID=UPI00234AE1E9|nr:protocadherin gamma-C5-like isoform X19 [Spea bombifrons]